MTEQHSTGMTEQHSTGWIPMPPAEGGRLPTNHNVLYRVSFGGGVHPDKWTVEEIERAARKGNARLEAWWDLYHGEPPRPYVPPEPEKPPQRRTLQSHVHSYTVDKTNDPPEVRDLQLRVIKHTGFTYGQVNELITFREELPGDIDPDAARSLVEWCEKQESNLIEGLSSYGIDEFRRLLAACRKGE